MTRDLIVSLTPHPIPSHPIPSLARSLPQPAAVDMVRSHAHGTHAVEMYLNHPAVAKMNYLDLFSRTRVIIKHHPIFSDNGIVEPLRCGIPAPG